MTWKDAGQHFYHTLDMENNTALHHYYITIVILPCYYIKIALLGSTEIGIL